MAKKPSFFERHCNYDISFVIVSKVFFWNLDYAVDKMLPPFSITFVLNYATHFLFATKQKIGHASKAQC